MFNGTPRGYNHAYKLAKLAKKNPDWFYQHLTAKDTGVPSEEEIEAERRAGMPESLIQQEFYTHWGASSEDTLIPLESIIKATKTILPIEAYSHAAKILGVDPAYAEKGDKAVIAFRQGRRVFPLEKHQGIDPMALASRVAQRIQEDDPLYVFVDAGRGEAVWSRLYQLGYEHKVIPVHFGGKTYSEFYYRRKDEMWGRMKDYICVPDTPPQLPEDEDLIRDLSAPTFDLEAGKLRLESKKSLRRRGFPSTDCGDALALTFAEDPRGLDAEQSPIPAKILQEFQHIPKQLLTRHLEAITEQTQGSYDPMNYMDRIMGYV
jgi:hypothetical protein